MRQSRAPGRARDADQRSGSFKPGHKKLGGRKRGTPNAASPDYRKTIIEAACRVGGDGGGRDGLVGYLRWVARHHPKVFCSQFLPNVLAMELSRTTLDAN